MRNNQALLQDLENQVGQIVKLLLERPQGSLVRNIEANSRMHLKAITLMSGKQVEMRREITLSKEKETIVESQEELLQEKELTLNIEKIVPLPIKQYMPQLPYPSRLMKNEMYEKFKCFLDLHKQLHINVPFVEVLFQMKKYAKFLKDLVTNKQKFEEVSWLY